MSRGAVSREAGCTGRGMCSVGVCRVGCTPLCEQNDRQVQKHYHVFRPSSDLPMLKFAAKN